MKSHLTDQNSGFDAGSDNGSNANPNSSPNANPNSEFIEQTTIKQFFQELVDKACENQRRNFIVESRFYVVNLLTSFVQADILDYGVGRRTLFAPLAQMYLQAQELRPRFLRYQQLRRLGDASLFVSGLFADSLNRRLVDMDYYIAMGGNAYGALCHVSLDSVHPGFSDIYRELSGRFVDFVDVLSEVSEQANLSGTPDTLRLYETWLRSGSARAAMRLRQRGVEPNVCLGMRNH